MKLYHFGINLAAVKGRSVLLAFAVVAGAVVGCSERQAEPDYTELIRDTCEIGCSHSLECGTNELYDDLQECIEGCTASDGWEALNQCDSLFIAFKQCEVELTCEDLALWEEPLDADGSLKDELPCGDVALEWYSCDNNKPFDPPE